MKSKGYIDVCFLIKQGIPKEVPGQRLWVGPAAPQSSVPVRESPNLLLSPGFQTLATQWFGTANPRAALEHPLGSLCQGSSAVLFLMPEVQEDPVSSWLSCRVVEAQTLFSSGVQDKESPWVKPLYLFLQVRFHVSWTVHKADNEIAPANVPKAVGEDKQSSSLQQPPPTPTCPFPNLALFTLSPCCLKALWQ